MLNRTLLIVDDDKTWLRTLTRWFTPLGYKIETAATCADAIMLIQAIHPDCLLLDFYLEDGTAKDVAGFIRNSVKFRKIPIIIVSGYQQEELVSHYQCQADDFILKGAPLSSITLSVERLLRRVALERGIIEKGDIRLCAGDRRVFRGTNPVAELSPEHFRFLSHLLEKSPDSVSEEELCRAVLDIEFTDEKCDALKMMAYRLRLKLGKRIGRRIKNKKDSGWIYVQPEPRPSVPPL